MNRSKIALGWIGVFSAFFFMFVGAFVTFISLEKDQAILPYIPTQYNIITGCVMCAFGVSLGLYLYTEILKTETIDLEETEKH